ncbi:helix-turn-helix domain-containing protein [Geodermatophilus sp. SYSU D00758]
MQLAFRRHRNTTPTAYLRQVRLAQAHRELRDATPGDGVTVTAVAARWGFTPSRFTERYRAAYGVLPAPPCAPEPPPRPARSRRPSSPRRSASARCWHAAASVTSSTA